MLAFTGPDAGSHAAHDQPMGVWLPAFGEVPADSPMFEVYLNGPLDTAPEALVTEVCLTLLD